MRGLSWPELTLLCSQTGQDRAQNRIGGGPAVAAGFRAVARTLRAVHPRRVRNLWSRKWHPSLISPIRQRTHPGRPGHDHGSRSVPHFVAVLGPEPSRDIRSQVSVLRRSASSTRSQATSASCKFSACNSHPFPISHPARYTAATFRPWLADSAEVYREPLRLCWGHGSAPLNEAQMPDNRRTGGAPSAACPTLAGTLSSRTFSSRSPLSFWFLRRSFRPPNKWLDEPARRLERTTFSLPRTARRSTAPRPAAAQYAIPPAGSDLIATSPCAAVRRRLKAQIRATCPSRARVAATRRSLSALRRARESTRRAAFGRLKPGPRRRSAAASGR